MFAVENLRIVKTGTVQCQVFAGVEDPQEESTGEESGIHWRMVRLLLESLGLLDSSFASSLTWSST